MHDIIVKSVYTWTLYTVEIEWPWAIEGIVVLCRFRVAPLVTYL